MNNKIRKNIILILSIILIILIIGLLIFIVSNSQKLKNDNTQLIKETISTNKSKKIKEDHCLEELCLINTKIIYDNKNKIGEIEFYFKNKGTETIPPGFVKVVIKDNPKISFIAYHLELKPNSEASSLIQFEDKKIINIEDYELEPLTDKELEEAQKNLN